jgi:hypothetical protein
VWTSIFHSRRQLLADITSTPGRVPEALTVSFSE